MTTSTPRPPDGPPPPSESLLQSLLRIGGPELAAVEESRLTRIWHRVDHDLADADATAGDADAGADPVADRLSSGMRPTSDRPDTPHASASSPVPMSAMAARRRGWRAHVPLAAAAAVALVVGVGFGASLAGPDDPPPATTLATYELEPLAADGSTEPAAVGAVLVADAQGRALEVDLEALPTTEGFHEVWLLDPETGALASLGPVRPDGRYVVPSGTDLDELTALDVSVEPLDGDPGHSGVSLLRGEVTWIG